MIRFRVLACIAIVSSAVACASESEFASVEQENGGANCPIQLCNNSDEIAHYGVWEANLWGAPDIHGISLRTIKGGRAAIYKDNIAYALSVENDHIIGTHSYFSSIKGEALVGARLEMMRNGAPYYSITIKGVRNGIAFPTPPADPIETYTLVWHEPGTDSQRGKAFCNSILQNNNETKNFDLFGMEPYESVVFRGDRFDAQKKMVNVTADNNWINFGCAGHTLAKLYLNRYTVNTHPTNDWAQRQAMLKMMVGDYCGSRTGRGEEFTRAGEPIAWKGGLHPSYPSMAQLTVDEAPLDARWDEKGATCVYNPRMQKSTHPDAATEFPDALEQIRHACPTIPTCMNPDPEAFDGARVVSANRIPLP